MLTHLPLMANYCRVLWMIMVSQNEPTRITEGTSSELDQIIVNCDHTVSDIAMTRLVLHNDHHTLSCIK